MSQVDISLLRRILPTLLEEDPVQGNQIQMAIQMADSDHEEQILIDNRANLVGSLEEAETYLRNQEASNRILTAVVQGAAQDSNPEELSESELRTVINNFQEEDSILTSEEVRPQLEEILQANREQISILTRNRDGLVGSMENAIELLRSQNASQMTLMAVAQGAARDGNPEEISASELRIVTENFQESIEGMTPERFIRDVRSQIRDMEQLRRLRPEVFLPQSPEARRAPIDLNFLKSFGPQEVSFLSQVYRNLMNGTINLQDPNLSPQITFALQVLELVAAAEIDITDDNARNSGENWQLTIQQYENYRNQQLERNQVPENQRQRLHSVEIGFSDLRARAFRIRQGLAGQTSGPHRVGVDIAPLASQQVAQTELGIRTLIFAAGEDQLLNGEEARLVTDRLHLLDGTRMTPQAYMTRAQELVDTHGDFGFRIEQEMPPGPGQARTQVINRTVMRDLGYMINGYADYDRYMVENHLITNLIHGVTYLCTLPIPIGWMADIEPEYEEDDLVGGSLPLWNPTYMQYARGDADSNRSYRVQAATFLGGLIGIDFRPSLESGNRMPEQQTGPWGPDREFLRWLETRPEGQREVNIPNALEYMRTYGERFEAEARQLMASGRYDNSVDARGSLFSRGMENPLIVSRYHAILTGPLCRVPRLHEIRSIRDRGEADRAWLQFAQNIEERVWSFWGPHTTDGEGYWGAETRPGTGHFGSDTQSFSQGAGTFLWSRNVFFSRSIYGSLMRRSQDPDIVAQARGLRQDSMGQDITDQEGNLIEPEGFLGNFHSNRGGGAFGFVNPIRWFRNYSHENSDLGVGEAVLIIPLFRAARFGLRGIASLRTAGPAIRAAIVNAGGLRAASMGVIRNLGLFTGNIGRWISGTGRTATQAAARNAAAQTARSAAPAATRTAVNVVRRPGFWTPFKEGLRRVNGVGSFLEWASSWPRSALQGIKNLGGNTLRRFMQSSAGQSRAVQGTIETTRQAGFGLPRWLGGNHLRNGIRWLSERLAPRAGQPLANGGSGSLSLGQRLGNLTTQTARGAQNILDNHMTLQGLGRAVAWPFLQIKRALTWENIFAYGIGFMMRKEQDATPDAPGIPLEDGRLNQDRRFRHDEPRSLLQQEAAAPDSDDDDSTEPSPVQTPSPNPGPYADDE